MTQQPTTGRTAQPHPMRILVVDNHELFRAGLREMLAAVGIGAVEEATGGERALEIVRQRAPNVVVTELHLTGMSASR